MGTSSDQSQPGAVLFACTLNAVRSPMAEALMKHLYGTSIFVDSAGVECAELDLFVLEVLKEVGYERDVHRTKSLDDLQDHAFDLIIALSPEARDKALEIVQGEAVEVEYWPAADPTRENGSREQRLEAYRRLRDDLIARMKERFGDQIAKAS
ncbi:MAG: arsenate reductase ArsC [Rhodobiaceae bacterium]|nr:arsenate reductase ArsC [Rhodobiaceae bacterium]